MWIFTKYGFFSVVALASMGPSTRGELITATGVQIRARSRRHLANLQRRFRSLRKLRIMATPDADYRFRLLTTAENWTSIAECLAREVDYPNFKSECFGQVRAGKLDAAYEAVLHRVWSEMFSYQIESGGRARLFGWRIKT